MCLSIIIPVFNEEEFIGKTIQRIIDVTGRALIYEIISINNASTDRTQEILDSFPQINTLKLTNKVTVSEARNIGYHSAKFPIVAFIDADMLLTSAWIDTFKKIKDDLSLNRFQITGCKVSLSENPSWLEEIWFGNMDLTKTGQKYINSGNLITTAAVMDTLNGFDQNLITGEDVDFCRRGISKGVRISINNGFIAHHEGYPKTIDRFFKRERWHGIGDLKTLRTFLKSKVAIFSFAVVFLIIGSVFFAASGIFFISLICLGVALALNCYAIFSRFKIKNLTAVIGLFYLQILYAFARVLSIFDRTKI